MRVHQKYWDQITIVSDVSLSILIQIERIFLTMWYN
jgi:hypothetical protein